jgi:sulfoxide reductase heme-binding subunit YedZ
MASAYSALALLVVSLCLGPWNVLRSRPNPVSFDLRRDIGIWAGLVALFHTGVGLTVHLRGRMWMYFLKRLHPLTLQTTRFGFSNYMGLATAMVLLLLLLISNDISLRKLGIKRWKALQRFSYLAFALTMAHGAAYQLVEKQHRGWVFAFGVMA